MSGWKRIVALGAGLMLAGCATQHGNVLIFGTNTVVGLKLGTEVTQVPTLQLGYARQEAVVMPLLANTGAAGAACPAGLASPSAGQQQSLLDACKFLATRGSEEDTYSVLASFGAKLGTDQAPNGQTTRAGIAQYFATGLAARALASNGGAAVVASGRAAERAAIVASPIVQAQIVEAAERAENPIGQQKLLRQQVAGAIIAPGANVPAILKAMDAAIQTGPRPRTAFEQACAAAAAPADCAAVIARGDALDNLSLSDWQKAAAAASGGQ